MRIMGIFFLSGPYIVQGEGMKKRREIYKRRKLPAGGIFFGGFLVGILLPNILWKMEWRQKTAASLYLIGAFAEKTASGHEYLAEVLKIRGSLYLLAAFCGISVFGVPLAVTGILLTGFQTGILLAMSVLEFGLQGGLIGAGLLFPQYLIYLPCIFYLMNQVYRQSMGNLAQPRTVSGKNFRVCCPAVSVRYRIFCGNSSGSLLQSCSGRGSHEKPENFLKNQFDF